MKLLTVLHKLHDEYQDKTLKKLKLIDAYLTYILLTGIMQFVYCLLVGTFPFNSFLAGFISTVGSFVLAGLFAFFKFYITFFFFSVCLRIQVNPQNKSQFPHISPERAFADFIFAHVILHLVVANFLG